MSLLLFYYVMHGSEFFPLSKLIYEIEFDSAEMYGISVAASLLTKHIYYAAANESALEIHNGFAVIEIHAADELVDPDSRNLVGCIGISLDLHVFASAEIFTRNFLFFRFDGFTALL